MNLKRCLFHSYGRLDTEYDALRMIAEELRAKGKFYEADKVEEARKSLLAAISDVKASWKFLDEKDPLFEQIKMDL